MNTIDLAGLRLYSHAEVDQLMAESFRRRAQIEREDGEELECAHASLRTTPHRKDEVRYGEGATRVALATNLEATRPRTPAAMVPKARMLEHETFASGESSIDSPSGNVSDESTGDAELDSLLAALVASPDVREPSAAMVPIACVAPPDATEFDDVSVGEAPPLAGVAATLLVGPEALDRFPVASICEVPEFDDPVLALTGLCRDLQKHKSYRAVRARYCQISLRMNMEGKYAPAFRPRPRGEAPKGDPVHMLVFRDQLVIDYHWCHATRMFMSPSDVGHAHVLDLQADFDLIAAWLLTGANQTPKFRATEAMCLTRMQQCQTMRLHGPELEARLVAISGEYRRSGGKSRSELAKAKTAIGEWIERDPRMRKHQTSYERLWLARELLGPGASPSLIANLHALMEGEQPLDRKTMAGKLNRLYRNVDAFLKAPGTL